MLKIGALSYINALPFFYPFLQNTLRYSGDFIYGHPSSINALIHSGEIDIGLISSVHFLDHRKKYILLSSFGIAAANAMSVRLYFRSSIERLHKKQLVLTTSSATSVRLLHVLCRYVWNIEPKFVYDDFHNFDVLHQSEVEGFLLIGDICLKNSSFPQFQSIDLAQAWYEFTGKPFTFALFVTRCATWIQFPEEVKVFHNLLAEAFSLSKKEHNQIVQLAKSKTGLPISTLKEYYSCLEYELESKHFQGLERFAQLTASL